MRRDGEDGQKYSTSRTQPPCASVATSRFKLEAKDDDDVDARASGTSYVRKQYMMRPDKTA